VVKALLADVSQRDAELVIVEERFEFWAKRLWSRYPRANHRGMYDQIGRLSFYLAKQQCLASLQLFALACLGLDAVRTAEHASQDAFFRTHRSRNTQVTAQSMAASATTPMRYPGEGSGSGRIELQNTPSVSGVSVRQRHRAPTKKGA